VQAVISVSRGGVGWNEVGIAMVWVVCFDNGRRRQRARGEGPTSFPSTSRTLYTVLNFPRPSTPP